MTVPKSRGLLQVYTGDGKGKTTASLGVAIRAAARKMKVAIVYFDKGGEHYSERRILEQRFSGEIDFWATGLDRIDPANGRFRFGVLDEDRVEAQRGLEIVQALFDAGSHDLVILDEINTTVSLGMLAEDDVLDTLALKPEIMEVVLTGRNAPDSFIEHADLVSEMQLIKHYFYHGVPAREGIDF
ncbi:cob(I)yrinic acid a,c-diamide adenosyltransferase [Candidatus Uhrbacteria bacterium]|nr:cob(I)yrinic acid a,c-diamide adenosyltransferase [Candidatus Uhrbacteria bacterium]